MIRKEGDLHFISLAQNQNREVTSRVDSRSSFLSGFAKSENWVYGRKDGSSIDCGKLNWRPLVFEICAGFNRRIISIPEESNSVLLYPGSYTSS